MNVMMFAHDGSLNRGCEAIVRSSAQMIKERVRNAKVYLASGQPETDRIIGQLDGVLDGSPRTIRAYTPEWLLSALSVRMLRSESYVLGRIHRNIVKNIKHMDVCLSIGGDNYCYGEQPGLYEVDRRVKAQGKKLVLWGCSIGEEDMSPRKRSDLALFDLILTRESLTYKLLKEQGLDAVRLVADPAFTMEKEEMPLPEGWQEGNTIGLNFSPLVWKRNSGSKAAFARLIRHIVDHTDMTVALTPHVVMPGNDDYEVLREMHETFKSTGRVLLLPGDLNATQYKGYIARMRFFVGARTHATIAAYSSCVPTAVLGYSVKSKGIAADLFGEEKLVLGIGELSDHRKLIRAFEEMRADEAALREKLRQTLPGVRELSFKAAHYLEEVVL